MTSLLITLRGPLQSYGDVANYGYRTTWDYPSKSAIIGMLMAALGCPRSDTATMAELNQLGFAVRIDQLGELMQDFRTVQYKEGKGVKLCYVDYVSDAVFIVALSGDKETLVTLERAIHHPVWQLFFGRKCNAPGYIPTKIMDEDNPVQALSVFPWAGSEWRRRQLKRQDKKTITVSVFADAKYRSNELQSFRRDLPRSFDMRDRRYDYRAEVQLKTKLSV